MCLAILSIIVCPLSMSHQVRAAPEFVSIVQFGVPCGGWLFPFPLYVWSWVPCYYVQWRLVVVVAHVIVPCGRMMVFILALAHYSMRAVYVPYFIPCGRMIEHILVLSYSCRGCICGVQLCLATAAIFHFVFPCGVWLFPFPLFVWCWVP